MKEKIFLAGSLMLACMAFGSVAIADTPGQDWIPMEKVISIVKDHGYTSISELEADDGHWEGDGIKNGQKYEFHVDPHSGKITKDKPDD